GPRGPRHHPGTGPRGPMTRSLPRRRVCRCRQLGSTNRKKGAHMPQDTHRTDQTTNSPANSAHTNGQPRMRATRQEEFGGPDVRHEVEVPRPEPGISEIRVRVHAAGVNPTDSKYRSGRRFLGEPPY